MGYSRRAQGVRQCGSLSFAVTGHGAWSIGHGEIISDFGLRIEEGRDGDLNEEGGFFCALMAKG